MRIWKDYGLGIVYVVGWIVCWALHAYFTYTVSGYPHGEEPWVLDWLMTSFENLTSEMFQIGFFVIASAYLYYKGSGQSKDGEEKIQASLDRIEARLDRLEGKES